MCRAHACYNMQGLNVSLQCHRRVKHHSSKSSVWCAFAEPYFNNIQTTLWSHSISCFTGHITHKIVFFSGHLPSSEVNSLWASSSLQGQCWAFPPAKIFPLLQEISHSYSLPTCPLCVGERESERESSNSHEARKVKSVGEKIRDTVCE